LLFHQGISEAAVGPYDMHVKTELSINDLPLSKVRYAIAGDFHKRQFLKDGKFHYLGSPLQLSFSERNDVKAFTYIDADWNLHTIPTEAPRFYLFDSIAHYEKEKSQIRECDFVRIIDKDRVRLETLKESNPKIQTELVTEDTITQRRIDPKAEFDDAYLLSEWISKNMIPGISSEELLEEGMNLLKGETSDEHIWSQ
jgi:hypothetical protein